MHRPRIELEEQFIVPNDGAPESGSREMREQLIFEILLDIRDHLEEKIEAS